MPPTSPGTASYYLALNGTPNGPHRAAEVLELLRQGSIQGTTLICREGGAAWVPVAEMETALHIEVMPPPMPPQPAPAPSYVSTPPPLPAGALTRPVASGYGGSSGGGGSGAPAPRYQPRPLGPTVVHEAPRDGTKPLRFITLLGALGLFFLPWLEFRCSASKLPPQATGGMQGELIMLRQTGVETVLSRYSFDEDTLAKMEQFARMLGGPNLPPEQLAMFKDKRFTEGHDADDLGYAWFAGGAMLCIVIGLGASLGASGRSTCGMMALLALLCLGMQTLSGFPMHRLMETKMKESIKQRQLTGEQAKAMQKKLEETDIIAVKYTPWFYTELGLLALTAVIGMAGGPRRHT